MKRRTRELALARKLDEAFAKGVPLPEYKQRGRPPSGEAWMVPVTFQLRQQDLDRLDKKRGQQDRSLYIRNIVLKAIR